MQDLFAGLVPNEVIQACERLLARDGCAKDQADVLMGDAELGDALLARGMAHIQPHSPVDPAWLRPASPDLALQGVLAGQQNQLARHQEVLLAGTRRLAAAQARFSGTMHHELPAHMVLLLSDRAEISKLSASLINTARQDWMTLENLHTDMPLTDDFAQPPLPALSGRVRCRSIYAAAAMNHPVARRIIQSCAQAGEDVRLLPQVLMKMKLADRSSALLPLTPTGTAGALLLKAPLIVAALRDYFELLWERATPLVPPRTPLSADHLTAAQQRVLELMAEGIHDDAIARRAGISTTTVRRHIAAIMARLDVASRFAAGAAAQRRGWLG